MPDPGWTFAGVDAKLIGEKDEQAVKMELSSSALFIRWTKQVMRLGGDD